MEPFFIVAAIGVGIAFGLLGGGRWKEVAAQLGLHYSNGFQRKMTGMIDGFDIRVIQQKHHIDISVSGHNSIRETIKLSKEGFLSGIIGGRDIEIGCPSFDARTYISSFSRNSEAEVSALLDDKTRAIVSRVIVKGGAKVSGGSITTNKTTSIDEAPSVLHDLVELGHRLTMKATEVPERLAHNALNDALSSVRLRNLTLLQERYPNRQETYDTSASLLIDSNYSIRLAAAMFLGPDGLSVIEEIANARYAPVDVRSKALQHFVTKAEREDAIKMAMALLKDRSIRVRRKAIHCLGRLRHRPALEHVLPLLESASVATKLVIITALKRIGDPETETALIKLLEDPSDRVRTSAIESLAKIGTVKAVEPLYVLAKERRFKRQARTAIDSIQSRLGDVEAGRLSLAPNVDADGALSLAGDPETAGGLSLDENPEAP